MESNNTGVNCPSCGIGITTGNAGGYRTYCEGCVDKITALIEAQTLIVAMLNECGLSQVLIAHDDKYNRYAKKASHGGQGVYNRFERLEELYAEMKPAPEIIQASMFEDAL